MKTLQIQFSRDGVSGYLNYRQGRQTSESFAQSLGISPALLQKIKAGAPLSKRVCKILGFEIHGDNFAFSISE